MNGKYVFLLAFALIGKAISASTPISADKLQLQDVSPQPSQDYVPHAAYPYAETYPGAYDGYLVPAGNLQYAPPGEYMTALMPTARTALQIALRIFAKIGLFLVGGVALLVVGGIFTTAVCSLTPYCSITFAPFNNINKDSVRSLVTPDNLSAAAGFVQDAIGKYQRLQRAVGNN